MVLNSFICQSALKIGLDGNSFFYYSSCLENLAWQCIKQLPFINLSLLLFKQLHQVFSLYCFRQLQYEREKVLLLELEKEMDQKYLGLLAQVSSDSHPFMLYLI